MIFWCQFKSIAVIFQIFGFIACYSAENIMQQSLRAVYARISELKDRICPYSAYIGGNTCGNLFVAFNGNSELSSDLHAECTANASFHQVEFHEISNEGSFIALLTADPGSTVLLHTCHQQDVMNRLFDLVRNAAIRILFTSPAIVDLTPVSSPELLHESFEDMQLSAIWKSSNNLDLVSPVHILQFNLLNMRRFLCNVVVLSDTAFNELSIVSDCMNR